MYVISNVNHVSIHTRKDREKLKIFFIYDLTACMDDVNMLAFLDILKYQMSTDKSSSKKTMDQLFFITCDERIVICWNIS